MARDPYTQLAARLATAGRDTFLADESVLALHELALVDPPSIQLITTRRMRRALPPDTQLRHDPTLGPDEVTTYYGLASMTVAAALTTCLPRLVPERALTAVRQALRDGHIDKQQAQQIRVTIRRQREREGLSPTGRTPHLTPEGG